jgi:pimeloyl-ACP methyl ester carboxylesterase
VAPDRPGHGRSPDARQDFEAEAPLIADQFLGEPVHLVGHSYGAIVATLGAASRPEEVKSLTLIEPPATGAAKGNPAVDAWAEQLDSLFSDPGDDLSALLARFFELEGVHMPVPQPLPEPLERGARALASARPATEAELPLGAVAAAGLPCLVISGGHHEGYEAVCNVIAEQTDAQRAVIRGAGHLVPDTGDPFNRRLEEFLLENER